MTVDYNEMYIPAQCQSCKEEVGCSNIFPYDNSERCWDCFTKETGKTTSDVNDQLAYMFPARNPDKSIKDPVWHQKLLEKIQNRNEELKK